MLQCRRNGYDDVDAHRDMLKSQKRPGVPFWDALFVFHQSPIKRQQKR